MRRIDKKAASIAVLASLALAGAAVAGPAINDAAVFSRIFNDCPGSNHTVLENYPAQITFTDQSVSCVGFANLHEWRLSDNGGASRAFFANGDCFSIKVDLVLASIGGGQAEAGLGINPWWTLDAGRFQVRTTDGEIAAFGGRMPFYRFSSPPHNLVYTPGTPITLEMIYQPNGLSMASPGTIEYKVTYNSMTYSSGALAFDEGNPDEDPPYGLWGILNDAGVGGHLQFFVGQSGATGGVDATWRNIVYTPCIVGVEPGSWSQVKGLYR
jgi:hypothetical protein